jgi:hypothetical protein
MSRFQAFLIGADGMSRKLIEDQLTDTGVTELVQSKVLADMSVNEELVIRRVDPA